MKTRRFGYFFVLINLVTTTLFSACQPIQPASEQAAPVHDHATDHPTAEEAAAVAGAAPLLGNLGDHTHPIATKSELAQKYFDEGLILTFGFNHAEAIRSYNDALKLDPDCAMCYWGIAYALGPNSNAPAMDPTAVKPAWDTLQQAIKLATQASSAAQSPNNPSALLQAGRAADAEAVYRADLKEYRNNGWALFGLMKSLEAQSKTSEAAEVQKEFEKA